jgi:uncharacterized protein
MIFHIRKSIMKKMTNILIAILIIYTAVFALYYFKQDSLLFFPRPVTQPVPPDEHVEEVTITTENGILLHGWLCKLPDNQSQKLVIYFGGNAEEVSHMIDKAGEFDGWALLLVNYPGYGNSEGKPGERSFFEASMAILDYAVSRDDIDPHNIVLMGRSIGTGSAVYLAHKRPAKAVILISPFESILAVAQSKSPFLPVGMILRHKFESEKYAAGIDVPLLAFYGTSDKIVPPKHTKKLAGQWKGPVSLVELHGYGHNDIFESEKLWRDIIRFLESL